MNVINTNPFKILKSWQHHLNEENLSGVLKLYDIGCVLIPTFSSEIITNHEKIKEYFIDVIKIQKGKVEFQSNSVSDQKVGQNKYLMSGKYIFHLKGKEKIPARFSFLVNLLSETPIIHHHSSQSISN